MKSFLPCMLAVLFSNSFIAQKWAEDMQKPDANLYQIQAEFEAYWSTHDRTEKGKGYKAFRRWEDFVAPRVYPTGDLSVLHQTGRNYEAFLKSLQGNAGPGKPLGSGNNLIASSTFTPMGPFGALSGVANNGLSRKSGRLNFLTIDPTNTLTLWVGAPAGGLWKSTNGGSSWTTTTDQLAVTGCSDLAIDPTNTNIMYLATGDGDAGDNQSIGVLKSTDGGATWNPTGLAVPVSNYFLIRRLIINPSNPQILLAATNTGLYRTTDGGVTWSITSTAGVYDVEFKPGDPNTVYVAGAVFRLSTNGGATFTTITSGVPASVQRFAIAVTPDDPSYVYLLASNGVNSGFLGLYRSVVSGTAFTTMATSPNLLGWSNLGNDVGGQGWYDICVAASPLNKDEVVVGGVNVWKSLDGGVSWAINGHWTATGAPYTHSDQHDLEYATDGTLYACNDGTIYRRTSSTWVEICGLMNIAQIYKIGLSSQTAMKWITGHQDNGTNIYTGTAYTARLAGDGMDCFYDRTNDMNVFGSANNGALQRSTNGGTSWVSCTSGLPGGAPWVTVWKQDPQIASMVYCGLNNLYFSNNLAVSAWTQLTALPISGSINEFAIAPSNSQVIYVLKNSGICKTINGGTNWTNVSSGVPVGSAAPTFITIHPTDPNTAWVTLSGYSAGNKVFMTTNGGTSWTNFSANLPNLPANCSVYEPGSNGTIYVGMDVGIYYRNTSSLQWTLYNTGLPNTPVRDLEISPATPGLLHAATYGRGVWVASVNAATTPPISLFSAPANGLCVAATITFTDLSSSLPSGWNWSVLPSAGVVISSATAQNPSISFPSAGNYTVTLQASNGIGAGNTYSQVVTISNPPAMVVTPVTATNVCRNSPVVFSASGAGTYSWSGGGSASTATFFPISTVVYTVSGTTNSCAAVKTVTANGLPLPVVSISGATMVCEGDEVTLTGNGASTYSWSSAATGTSIVLVASAATNFSVTGVDANGCENVAYFNLQVTICEGIGSNQELNSGSFSIFPNPAKNKITVTSNELPVTSIQVEILDVTGRIVISRTIYLEQSNRSGDIVVENLSSGTYFVRLSTERDSPEIFRIIKE